MLDYGIIGNCLTCALIRKTGSVDWMCFPDFASPSVFGKLLDAKQGGSLDIRASGFSTTQRYLEDTAILETTFESKDGKESFVVYDFFPRYKKLTKKDSKQLVKTNQLVRIIKPLKGKPTIKVHFDPKPNYALEVFDFKIEKDRLLCESPNNSFCLISNIPFETLLEKGQVVLDRTKYLVFGDSEKDGAPFSVKTVNDLMRATRRYWKEWVKTLVLPEKNRNKIVRSAITLKLLTYSPTGAIVAAPTTSIPEEVGSERTWDYRFCWVRDAALTVDALKKIGRDYEAKKLLEFIIKNVQYNDFIQIMYGIHGETRLREYFLPHLEGFKGSKPVRVGNAAYNQIQHDIYGEILDVMYLYFSYYRYESRMTKKYWRFIVFLVNQIKFTWDKPDSGIWEFRGLMRHYTFSKFMCYVGVDRAIKMAQDYKRTERLQEWIELRDEIKEDILKNGYNTDVEAFTMFYGADVLDASLLQLTYHEFLEETDPRIINTIKAIYNTLRHDYLVKRYDDDDDFGKSGSSFTICSYWLVDALFSIGEEEKARNIFDKLIKHGNHLGLFSEDIDIKTKKLIGNFPQAYTHIALINSSLLLSEWSTKRKVIDWSQLPRRKRWF